MHWWIFYGLLTIGSVTTVFFRKRRPRDTLGAVFLLAILWLAWNLSHWFLEPYTQFFPVMDALATGSLVWLWKYRVNWWRGLLISLFLSECYIHAAYFALGDHSREALYAYNLKQNLIYAAQLACVTWAAISGKVRERG